MAGQRRELTLLDCLGLGINGVVGSGIFLLPAVLYRRAGGASPLAWLIVGGLCTLVALCFAEAAGATDRSGGPYRYACDAFGTRIGFAVGWITLVSTLLGYAAVARGFAEHAAWLAGRSSPGFAQLTAVVLIAALGVLNVRGLKPSAHTSDLVGAVKVVALLAFVVLLGAHGCHPASLALPPAPQPGEPTGLFTAAFAGLFACTGFEYVPVPAGETQHPERTIGIAMVASVLGATLLYALVQLVVVAHCPDLGNSRTPLVDAARAALGTPGATAVALIGLVSAFGFCAGSALVASRYVAAFAEDRFLPAVLARRGRRGTPVQAIAGVSVASAALAALLDFTSLADISNLAVVVQYVSTCSAVLIMRRRPGAPTRRLPGGPLVPLAALAGSLAFLSGVSARELAWGGALVAAGVAYGLAARGRSR
jgi:amino acid transporter